MNDGPEQLIKFCKKEHNIHSGAALRIGTLYDYRHIENPEIRDAEEGKYTFLIDFPEEITLDRRWSNLLLQGAVGFGGSDDTPRFAGSMNASIENLYIVEQRGENVVVRDTRIRIEREVPNCFMFCMSLMSAATKPFDGYDDKWIIPFQQVQSFANTLAGLFFEQIPLACFEGSITKALTPKTASMLSLNIQHRPVIYEDRHLVITEQNRPSYDRLIEVLSNMAFTKPRKFEAEQEYRFVFELNNGRRLFQPAENHFMIQPNPFKNLI